MFFNMTREPGNLAHVFRQESNLVKMAMAQGFQTHYYSAQTANLATFSGIEYANDSLTAENYGRTLETRHDAVLLLQADVEQQSALMKELDLLALPKPAATFDGYMAASPKLHPGREAALRAYWKALPRWKP